MSGRVTRVAHECAKLIGKKHRHVGIPATPVTRLFSSSANVGTDPAPSSASPTVDNAEIHKFGVYGKTWWDESAARQGGAGPLHSLNPVRVRYMADLRPGGLKGLRVLDVGCGGGLLSEGLARLGADVTGIDPSKENIEVARAHASVDPLTAGIHYRHTTAEELQAFGEQFDIVVASEVIEHVNDPATFVGCLAGLVREEGGEVVLTTVNRTLKAYLLAIVGAEYIAKVIPKGTHEWQRFLQPQELARLVRQSALRVVDVQGLVYDPMKDAWRLDQEDVDVNYILCAKTGKE